MTEHSISLSVIVPAYNEEKYISNTLSAIRTGLDSLPKDITAEIIVVDHSSTDETARSCSKADRVISLARGGPIGSARNFGAQCSSGQWLVFIDADTIVPSEVLSAIVNHFREGVAGGAVPGRYFPKKFSLRIFSAMWAWYASHATKPITQGVCQFVRSDVFRAIGGYDESIWYAEDTEFYWRLYDYAAARHMRLKIPKDLVVFPSSRRLDNWPAWRVIMKTNPLTTRIRLRSARFWKAWYDDHAPR